MLRRPYVLVAAIVVVVVALAVLAVTVIAPSGKSSAPAAVLDRLSKRPGAEEAKVLVERDWGSGELVLSGYERSADRRLGLSFVRHGPRGWRVATYTEQTVEKSDVVVGSLLIASSEGGAGQPAWSAAMGELSDPRIDRVEISWSNGRKTVAGRVDDAYLVVERGTTTADTARYLAKDGTEIAKVPIRGA